MLTLLLTPLLLLVIAVMTDKKDVSVVSKALAVIFLVDIVSWPLVSSEYYFLRLAIIDLLMFVTVLWLKDDEQAFIIGTACLISFTMNIYEHWSWYATIFYDMRVYIQWFLVQTIVAVLATNVAWNKTFKKEKK